MPLFLFDIVAALYYIIPAFTITLLPAKIAKCFDKTQDNKAIVQLSVQLSDAHPS